MEKGYVGMATIEEIRSNSTLLGKTRSFVIFKPKITHKIKEACQGGDQLPDGRSKCHHLLPF